MVGKKKIRRQTKLIKPFRDMILKFYFVLRTHLYQHRIYISKTSLKEIDARLLLSSEVFIATGLLEVSLVAVSRVST